MNKNDSITLPGDTPGLIRRGSPVLAVWGEEAIEDGEYSASGVVLSTRDAAGVSVACCGWDDGDADQSAAIDTLHLDLTDPTGRDHAVRWLASNVRHALGGTLDPAEGVRWHRSHRGHWELHCQRADEHRKWQEVCFLPWEGDDNLSDINGGPHSGWCRFVPALRELDLDPDGHDLIDAEALRRVCLHVAALTQ